MAIPNAMLIGGGDLWTAVPSSPTGVILSNSGLTQFTLQNVTGFQTVFSYYSDAAAGGTGGNVLILCGSGITVSTDGGNTWSENLIAFDTTQFSNGWAFPIPNNQVWCWKPGTTMARFTLLTDELGNLHMAQTAGQSGLTKPTFPTSRGMTVSDGTPITWKRVASGTYPTWQANTVYPQFSLITDSFNHIQQAKYGGTSGSSTPPWVSANNSNPFYSDNTVLWRTTISGGFPVTALSNDWQPQFFYPSGALVQDSNGNLQQAQNAGMSGTAHPTWATVLGATTVDGGGAFNWVCLAPYTTSTTTNGGHHIPNTSWQGADRLLGQGAGPSIAINSSATQAIAVGLEDRIVYTYSNFSATLSGVPIPDALFPVVLGGSASNTSLICVEATGSMGGLNFASGTLSIVWEGAVIGPTSGPLSYPAIGGGFTNPIIVGSWQGEMTNNFQSVWSINLGNGISSVPVTANSNTPAYGVLTSPATNNQATDNTITAYAPTGTATSSFFSMVPPVVKMVNCQATQNSSNQQFVGLTPIAGAAGGDLVVFHALTNIQGGIHLVGKSNNAGYADFTVDAYNNIWAVKATASTLTLFQLQFSDNPSSANGGSNTSGVPAYANDPDTIHPIITKQTINLTAFSTDTSTAPKIMYVQGDQQLGEIVIARGATLLKYNPLTGAITGPQVTFQNCNTNGAGQYLQWSQTGVYIGNGSSGNRSMLGSCIWFFAGPNSGDITGWDCINWKIIERFNLTTDLGINDTVNPGFVVGAPTGSIQTGLIGDLYLWFTSTSNTKKVWLAKINRVSSNLTNVCAIYRSAAPFTSWTYSNNVPSQIQATGVEPLCAAWINGNFVLGTFNYTATSADGGASWQTFFNGGGDWVVMINNGSYVLGLDDSGNWVKTSDGITWTTGSTPFFMNWPQPHYPLIWDPILSLWVVIAEDSVSNFIATYTSPDGQTWTKRYAGTSGDNLTVLFQGATEYFAFGFVKATGQAVTVKTTNPAGTWVRTQHAEAVANFWAGGSGAGQYGVSWSLTDTTFLGQHLESAHLWITNNDTATYTEDS